MFPNNLHSLETVSIIPCLWETGRVPLLTMPYSCAWQRFTRTHDKAPLIDYSAACENRQKTYKLTPSFSPKGYLVFFWFWRLGRDGMMILLKLFLQIKWKTGECYSARILSRSEHAAVTSKWSERGSLSGHFGAWGTWKAAVIHFSWKKLPKGFASSEKVRTFALAFGKQPGRRCSGGIFLPAILEVWKVIFDRLRTEYKTSSAYTLYIL